MWSSGNLENVLCCVFNLNAVSPPVAGPGITLLSLFNTFGGDALELRLCMSVNVLVLSVYMISFDVMRLLRSLSKSEFGVAFVHVCGGRCMLAL